MNKFIYNIVTIFLLLSLFSCTKEVIQTSVTINGDPYIEKKQNSLIGPYPTKYITFLNTNNFGFSNSILSPVDKNKPTYGMFIYIQGSGDNFITGKKLKIGEPLNTTYLFNNTLENISQINNIDTLIPDECDGIALFFEVSGNEYLNPRGISGTIEIYNYISHTGFYECRYFFKNDNIPKISFINGYLSVIKANIK